MKITNMTIGAIIFFRYKALLKSDVCFCDLFFNNKYYVTLSIHNDV